MHAPFLLPLPCSAVILCRQYKSHSKQLWLCLMYKASPHVHKPSQSYARSAKKNYDAVMFPPRLQKYKKRHQVLLLTPKPECTRKLPKPTTPLMLTITRPQKQILCNNRTGLTLKWVLWTKEQRSLSPFVFPEPQKSQSGVNTDWTVSFSAHNLPEVQANIALVAARYKA